MLSNLWAKSCSLFSSIILLMTVKSIVMHLFNLFLVICVLSHLFLAWLEDYLFYWCFHISTFGYVDFFYYFLFLISLIYALFQIIISSDLGGNLNFSSLCHFLNGNLYCWFFNIFVFILFTSQLFPIVPFKSIIEWVG